MKRLYHIDFATLHNKHSDHLSNDVQSDETVYFLLPNRIC